MTYTCKRSDIYERLQNKLSLRREKQHDIYKQCIATEKSKETVNDENDHHDNNSNNVNEHIIVDASKVTLLSSNNNHNVHEHDTVNNTQENNENDSGSSHMTDTYSTQASISDIKQNSSSINDNDSNHDIDIANSNHTTDVETTNEQENTNEQDQCASTCQKKQGWIHFSKGNYEFAIECYTAVSTVAYKLCNVCVIHTFFGLVKDCIYMYMTTYN